MLWAITNLTGNNRVTKALAVRYSAIPLSDTSSSSSSSSLSTTSGTVTTTQSGRNLLGGGGSGGNVIHHEIILPLDVEETVTCFCRKARRKERDGDQSSTDTKLYLEESVLERKLPDADLKALVDLPAGLDYNEWLASHTLALFEHVNLVYGTISEFCTTSGCPDMTGPGNRTYLWFDEKGKKTRVAAPQYIDYVMTFTQKTVSDETIFPTKYANEFPSSFESIARKILRLQFHVIAHLYASHFREIALLGLHTHLNLTFAHLTALHRRFNLIDEKETDVLRDLEVALRLTDDGTNNTSSTTTNNTSSVSSSLSSSNSTTTNTSNITNMTMTTTTSSTATTNFTNCGDSSGTGLSSLSAIIGGGGGVGGVGDDGNLMYQQHHQQHYNNSNSNNSTTTTTTATAGATASQLAASTTKIDGDASVQPICTQPEAMKSLSSDQSDIRGGAGGGGGGGGVGVANINVLGGYCSNNSGLNSSHIGGIMNFNNNNNNNNHNNSSTHPLTPGSLIQCNASNTTSSNSSSNSHTTTTA